MHLLRHCGHILETQAWQKQFSFDRSNSLFLEGQEPLLPVTGPNMAFLHKVRESLKDLEASYFFACKSYRFIFLLSK